MDRIWAPVASNEIRQIIVSSDGHMSPFLLFKDCSLYFPQERTTVKLQGDIEKVIHIYQK